MKNPIVCSALFKTPSSIEQLMEIAETMSNSSEAWLMMTFTLNYCHMMVREELDREEARQEELSVMRDAVAPRKDRRQLELF
jgi:TPP-dependent indolepyruvate ferredoxin oxidoreductase alpha subunit